MRIPLLAANWKMYKTPAEARSFVAAFLETPLPAKAEVAVFPPSIDLPATIDAAQGSALRVGAQNMYYADEGAFTGEISAPMLVAAGATHVLIGHSERRQYFGETNETVLKKTVAALDAGSTRELSELLAAADAALYRAKRDGRNQVQMISTTRGLSATGARTATAANAFGGPSTPSVWDVLPRRTPPVPSDADGVTVGALPRPLPLGSNRARTARRNQRARRAPPGWAKRRRARPG